MCCGVLGLIVMALPHFTSNIAKEITETNKVLQDEPSELCNESTSNMNIDNNCEVDETGETKQPKKVL